MGFGISFAPLVPPYVLWGAVALALMLAALLAFVRSRGWAVRAFALTLLLVFTPAAIHSYALYPPREASIRGSAVAITASVYPAVAGFGKPGGRYRRLCRA